ncbi:hypothetical protein PN441_05205 [Spirulina major CS-329]|uniref:hypothetical protein n=1 Tax=Spirulina TaxID=1154 RepID=UPI00232B247B|nr:MULTISPECIES: hypothetical protein [Spirulina]MDB9496283.1 hypothetical protein [Spirulina subsalsa CS-330]MDB9502462.1 hypothetical protein [Spirulina major CS-329]
MPSQQDWVNFALQRPNYFPGQYLLDEDFELAHRYLSDRQRYVNSRLHLAGIVEGLEVEAIAGQPEVVIKSGTAIDGEGNLVILPEDVTRKINGLGWLCLRYHQEPKILQQPEIPDSFTRFEEAPLLTLEAIHTDDAQTITLAKVSLVEGQVVIDSTVRQYSGVRLPSATQDITLRSNGQDLNIQGNLTIAGALQLGETLIEGVSQSIPAIDRPNVIPSEKAVKDHIRAALADKGETPAGEKPTIRLDEKDGKRVGWKVEGSGDENDPTALLRLIASEDGEEKLCVTVERETGTVTVHETLRVQHFELINPMRHRMYPNDAIVYQDVFDAEAAGAIENWKLTNNYERRHTAKNPWYQRAMIKYGYGKEDEGGALVTLPSGYDTVWVRNGNTLTDWHVIKAEFSESGKLFRSLGSWAAGKRGSNHYCPDGSLSDASTFLHQWLPIPVGASGKVSLVHKRDTDKEFWVSGVGFSKNPWAHAAQSALGYHWQVNGGDFVNWERDDNGGDVLAFIDDLTNAELRVPVVPSGRDKLLYLIEHNAEWNGCTHTGITIKVDDKDVPVERFLATYDNPFARHWNSKSRQRYIAARIPAALINDALQQPEPGDRLTQYISIKIDTRLNTQLSDKGGWADWQDRINFREIGTHDLELPYFV